MALHTFEMNDFTGVTCKECLAKESVVVCYGSHLVSNVDASSSIPCPKDDSSRSHDSVTGELLAEPDSLKLVNGDMLEPKQAPLEGDLKQSLLKNSGAIFLFEKRLTPSDCDAKTGRLQLPKSPTEKLYPLPSSQRKKTVHVGDTEGALWKFTLRWWPNRRSRRYVFDGARKCCLKMQWKVGDTLKFYQMPSDGNLIMELQKSCESSVKPPLKLTYNRRKTKAQQQVNKLSHIRKKGFKVGKKKISRKGN